jgi:hypothetical protein
MIKRNYLFRLELNKKVGWSNLKKDHWEYSGEADEYEWLEVLAVEPYLSGGMFRKKILTNYVCRVGQGSGVRSIWTLKKLDSKTIWFLIESGIYEEVNDD